MTEAWIDRFPDLAALPPEDQRLLTDRAAKVTLPAGTTVFAPGVAAQSFLLVLEGTVRVQQASPGGREIVLYRVTGGETCIMTTACLLSDEDYSAEGTAEAKWRRSRSPRPPSRRRLRARPGSAGWSLPTIRTAFPI